MKQDKPNWLKGIVTLKVTGHYPERFFDLCARHQMTVWSIKKVSDLECTGEIYLTDIKRIRQLRRKTHYKLSFTKRRGLPFFINSLKGFKPLLIILFTSILFFLYLTQSIWFIKVDGVSTVMENNILTSLSEYGVKRGKINFMIDNPQEIQRKLLTDYPNILWVGVVPDGITYRLEVIPKKQPPEQEINRPTHLYARKDGVISKIFVAKGRPLVKINDYVRKGQLLVTGELNHLEIDSDDEEKIVKLSEAEAEIYATTWYESHVSVPLKVEYQTETGQTHHKYRLLFGNFEVPIWGFGSSGFKFEHIETTETELLLGNWQLPISFKELNYKEVIPISQERTEQEAVDIGMEQARANLLRELGQSSSIIDEKILHQTTENGKVNLHVYFTVKENIVNTIDMNQGD